MKTRVCGISCGDVAVAVWFHPPWKRETGIQLLTDPRGHSQYPSWKKTNKNNGIIFFMFLSKKKVNGLQIVLKCFRIFIDIL